MDNNNTGQRNFINFIYMKAGGSSVIKTLEKDLLSALDLPLLEVQSLPLIVSMLPVVECVFILFLA